MNINQVEGFKSLLFRFDTDKRAIIKKYLSKVEYPSVINKKELELRLKNFDSKMVKSMILKGAKIYYNYTSKHLENMENEAFYECQKASKKVVEEIIKNSQNKELVREKFGEFSEEFVYGLHINDTETINIVIAYIFEINNIS